MPPTGRPTAPLAHLAAALLVASALVAAPARAGADEPAAPAAPATAAPDAAAQDTTDPASPDALAKALVAEEEARRKAVEEAKRRAEQEALDAAERLARRKAATLRRRTDPGAERAPVAPVNETEIQREKERETVGGAQLAATAAGTPVIVFEPPRPLPYAPSRMSLGRRTFAQFDLAGSATASLTVHVAERSERLALRLADVQRHVVARNEGSRMRLLEGVSPNDWLRLRLLDGSVVEGRFASVDEAMVHLRVPAAEAPPVATDVEVARIVQVDGLIASPSIVRALADLQADEPVGLVLWPDGREVAGRFRDRMEHHARLDTGGDATPDALVPVDAPIAEVRRIPPHWRQPARELTAGAVVRVRGFEEYPDARVERVYTAPLASVTAWAVAVRLPEGSAVLPFDALVSLDPATSHDTRAATHRLAPEALELPLLPGAPAEAARAAKLPEGISFVTVGATVTHVYVGPTYARGVCGMQVGTVAAESMAVSELSFGTEVLPRTQGGPDRPRELISETVDGLRVTAYVDGKGHISALEISRR
jgi:hypothetical protein